MTPGKELQITQRADLRGFLKVASDLKQAAIDKKEEDTANMLLSSEEIIKVFIAELSMWIALKNDKADMAWKCFVDAQMSAMWAAKAHDEIGEKIKEHTIYLENVEKVLFPKLAFFSIGATVTNATCSICEAEIGDCEHISGRAYMGKLCTNDINSLILKETSLVETPANKYCRVSVIEENGVRQDTLTYRSLPKNRNGIGRPHKPKKLSKTK
jgi:hypothetical protein